MNENKNLKIKHHLKFKFLRKPNIMLDDYYGPSSLITYGLVNEENFDLVNMILENEINYMFTGNGLLIKIPSLDNSLSVRSFVTYAEMNNYVYNLNSVKKLEKTLFNDHLTTSVLFTNQRHYRENKDVRDFTDFLKSKNIPINSYLID